MTPCRHRTPNPGWAATLQECIDSGTGCCATTWMPHRRPGALWIAGNHEDRLRNAVLDNPRAAFGVTRAKYEPDEKDHAVLSLPHLLRLDELGIDFVGGQSEYQHYRHKLADTLAVRHGYLSKTGPGIGGRHDPAATPFVRCDRPLPPARRGAFDRA